MRKKKEPIPINDVFPIEEARIFFAALFYGEHHTPEIKPFGIGWCVFPYERSFSTYDFSEMTRLVLLSHDRCIRSQIDCAGMKLRISIHKRQREGGITKEHPTIEESIERIRNSKYYHYDLTKR